MLQLGDLFAIGAVVKVLDDLVLEHERGGDDIRKLGYFGTVEARENVAIGKAWVRHWIEGWDVSRKTKWLSILTGLD